MKIDQLKAYLKLLSGNIGAQLLPLIAAPILLSFYDLDKFGKYGIFLSVLTIIVLVALSKFDSALFLRDSEFKHIESFVLVNTIVVLIISLPILIFFLKTSEIIPLILSAFLMTIYRLYYALFNLKNDINKMSLLKFIRQGSIVFGQILFLNFPSNGLIYGHFFGEIICVLYILSRLIKFNNFRLSLNIKHAISNYIEIGRKNLQFIYYSLPADLLNNFSNSLPMFYLDYIGSVKILGLFSILSRYILGPLSLISSVVSELFRSKLYQENNELNFKNDLYLLSRLVIFSFLGILVFKLSDKILITYYLRQDYSELISNALILILSFGFIKLIVSPFTHYYYLLKKNNFDFIWQVIYLIMTILAISLEYYNIGNIFFNILFSGILSYLINLIFIYRLSYGSNY